jgi:hypothetical protein
VPSNFIKIEAANAERRHCCCEIIVEGFDRLRLECLRHCDVAPDSGISGRLDLHEAAHSTQE